MSEEEIIRDFEQIVEESRTEDNYEYYIKLRDMLDLYNKEKEKNASLQKEIKLMKSININDNYISKDKIREKLEELKAMEISQDIYTTDIEKMFEDLLKE